MASNGWRGKPGIGVVGRQKSVQFKLLDSRHDGHPLAYCPLQVTPNLPEAAALTGAPVLTTAEAREAGSREAIGTPTRFVDVVYDRDRDAFSEIAMPRVPGTSTRGGRAL